MSPLDAPPPTTTTTSALPHPAEATNPIPKPQCNKNKKKKKKKKKQQQKLTSGWNPRSKTSTEAITDPRTFKQLVQLYHDTINIPTRISQGTSFQEALQLEALIGVQFEKDLREACLGKGFE